MYTSTARDGSKGPEGSAVVYFIQHSCHDSWLRWLQTSAEGADEAVERTWKFRSQHSMQ